MTRGGLGCSMSVDPLKAGRMTAQVNTRNRAQAHARDHLLSR